MASATKPVYVFVGGVSHTPEFFDAIIKELRDVHGVDSMAVAYPTCGDESMGTTQGDEVTAIQRTISSFVDGQHRNVVLVMHSYGGWPGSRAVKGLDIESRMNAGKTTGIVELVFLAAFLLPDNAPMAAYSYLPPWLDNEDGVRRPNAASVPLLFSDLDEANQKHWLSKFQWQRNDFTAETVPDAPWHLSIPKTYIVTMADKTATMDFQFSMLQGVLDATWSIKSINAGHEPMLSQPVNLAKVLLQPTF